MSCCVFLKKLLVLPVIVLTVETGVDQSWSRLRLQLLVAPAAVLTLETGVEKSWSKLRL